MDTELNETHEIIDNDDYYSDGDSDHIHSDNDDDEQYIDNTAYFGFNKRPQIKWTLIKIGKSILEVSSIGTIKPYRSLDNASEGIILDGTPYRYYSVEEDKNKYVNYYVHEIVWQAFNGTPNEMYEIKHKPEYTAKYRKIYSNRLHNITIIPKVRITPLKLCR
jgi:hypothetical protein